MKVSVLFIGFIFLNLPFCGISQCCSGGVPIAGSMGLSTTDKGNLQFLLTYDANVMDNLYAGNKALNDQLRERVTHSGMVEINYGLTDRLTVTSMISFVRQERKINQADGSINFTHTDGLGDGFLMLKFKLLVPAEVPKYNLAVGVGTKIPFGRTNFNDSNGLSLPADLQPGSGAWDMLLWSIYERYNAFIPNLNLSVSSTFRLTGTNDSYFETLRYRFGNEFILNFQGQYSILLNNRMGSLNLGWRYRNQKTDFLDDAIFPNSGGNFIFIVPGAGIQLSDDLQTAISGHIPIYNNVGGTQLVSSFRLSVSANYKIH
ncbi:MAG: hypothetical protein WAT37_08960 [Saprospiraceae bacterium]